MPRKSNDLRALALTAALLAALSAAHAQQNQAATGAMSAPGVGAAAKQAPAPVASKAALGSSITTVEQLLQVENALARQQAEKTKINAGLGKPQAAGVAGASGTTAKSVPAPMVVLVRSIYGRGEDLRANLMVDGTEFNGVRPGAQLKSCVVERITPGQVQLRPMQVADKVAARKQTACPSANWTGVNAAPAMAASGMGVTLGQPFNSLSGRMPAGGAPLPGGPLPSPVPSPIPGAPAGYAVPQQS